MLAAKTNVLIDTICVCLSAGTFIYVACTEIIVAEFARGKHSGWKLLLVILGGAAITSMWFFGHSHSHGNHDHGDHGDHHGHAH